jgi:MFS family permease
VTWRHRAWSVAAVTFLALVSAAAFRSSTGVFVEPIADEFGWSLSTVSFAVTVNFLVYGLVAPFGAAVLESIGVRRTVAAALVLLALGMALITVMTQTWQLVLFWGVFLGVGAGCLALVLGSVVANRWFVHRRGLVTGVFSAGSATGQLLFLPTLARLASEDGWRSASLLLAAVALAIVPVVLLVLRDRPSDVGQLPYGAPADWREPPPLHDGGAGPARVAMIRLREASRTKAFWLLVATFFICGWSTNGLIGTHFIPAAHDHGLPPTSAATLLAFVGLFDLAGVIGSGWLTDRYNPRVLLLVYYSLRGVSLLVVHLLWAPTVEVPMFFFVILFGLDWAATVPPTMALCRECFGLARSSVVFGWVYASHMIGAGVSAGVAGWIRQSTGSYDVAWWSSGALCLGAAAACWLIPRGFQLTRAGSRDPDPALTPG